MYKINGIRPDSHYKDRGGHTMGRMTKEEAKEIARQITEHGRKHGIPAKRKPRRPKK